MNDSVTANLADLETVDPDGQTTNLQNSNSQDDKGIKLSPIKSPSSKSTKLAVPLILKRGLTSSKNDPESNENIDENKKEIESNIVIKETAQRSSNRKKIKKSFGSDFLDMDDGQYSNARCASKKQRSKDCSFCLKNDGQIHHCKYCRVKGHELCFIANLGVSREGYKNKVVICKSCRNNCELCDKTDRAGELFFCSRCSSVFHKSCDANLNRLSKVVFGQWQCSFCDTLDSLVGDSLTEEQRKKEINRRKLLAMRKRLRKSDYILSKEDGLCSIQQVVKQAVKKRRTEVDQANIDCAKKIELSDEELDSSKHILNETQQLDFWSEDDSIDFSRLEDFLKKQRKNHNILSKHIKEDKKYYLLVKVLIDQLKVDKFECKKSNFLKLLNSDLFKRSFFEHNSLNGLTKGSTFLEGLTKCIEKCVHTEYWKTEDVNPISQKEYYVNRIENENSSEESTVLCETEQISNNTGKTNSPDQTETETKADLSENCKEIEENQSQILQDENVAESIVGQDKTESKSSDSENEDEDVNQDHLNQYRMHLEDESFLPEEERMEESNDLEANLECNKSNSNDDTINMNDENVEVVEKDVIKETVDEIIDETVQESVQETLKDDSKDELNNNDKESSRPPAINDHLNHKLVNKSNQPTNYDEKSNQENVEMVVDQPVTAKDLSKIDLPKENLIDETISDSDPCDLMCDEIINEKVTSDELSEMCENNAPVTKGMEISESLIENSSVIQINQASEESTYDESIVETSQPTNESTSRSTDISNDATNEKPESDDRSNHTTKYEVNNETAEKLIVELHKVVTSSNRSNSSTSESRPVSRNSQKVHKSSKCKANKPSTSKQSKSGKQKLKIKPSNNLVDKLFKHACKYNLSLLEPKYWTSEDVSIYLKQIGFENEAQCFKERSVDGKALLKLSRQEVLKNFGMKLGIAVKIFAYVHDLQIKNRCNINFD